MQKKYLHGLMREGRGFMQGELLPHATKKTQAGIIGIVAGVTIASEGLKGHNQTKLGRISYADGPARMTNSFTSGTIEAINRASNGNPEIANRLWVQAMRNGPGDTTPFRSLDNYGVDGAFISALYNMGG